MDECRIGVATRCSDPPLVVPKPKRRSSLGRISVDLQGLRPLLFAVAASRGLSPSELVRQALAAALDLQAPTPAVLERVIKRGRVRLGLRLAPAQAECLLSAAQQAGLPLGDFVMLALESSSSGQHGQNFGDAVSALIQSSSSLSTLSRDLRRLTSLLSAGSLGEALPYQQRFQTADKEVQAHLKCAAVVLAELQHVRRFSNAQPERKRGHAV